jgi:DNA-nicking Smr family endonuclease
MSDTMENPVHLPVDGILDLHSFSPHDIYSLLNEYIRECISKGIYQIKIIHGKGKGIQRGMVHQILEMDPRVISYGTDPGFSGWGATIAILRKEDEHH